MALKNLSVDDILAEMRTKSGKTQDSPLSDMQHVDKMIEEILTKRQNDALIKEKKELSTKEQKELENEIKVQTKSLTAEFHKLQKNSAITNSSPLPLYNKGASEKEPTIKPMKTTFDINKNIVENKVNDIEGHFGSFNPENMLEQKQLGKTNINIDKYKELKTNRSKKVETFTIDHKKSVDKVTDKPETDDNTYGKSINDNPTNENDEYEYTDPKQTADVLNNLLSTKKSTMISMVALLILSIISIVLIFTKVADGKLLVAGILQLKPSIYVILNMGILLVSTVFSFSIFTNAVSSLSEQKADKDCLYSILIIVCLIINIIFCLKPEKLLITEVTLYTPLVIIILFVNFFAKNLSMKKVIRNFGFITKDQPKYSVVCVQNKKNANDMTRGMLDDEAVLAKNVKLSFFENFIRNSFSADISDNFASKFAMFSIPTIIIIGALGFVRSGELFIALTVASGTMVLLTGFVGAIAVAFPLCDTAEVVSRFGGMMPEYATIDAYKDTNSFLLDAADLLPNNSIILHGIKTFQGKRIDEAIVAAASVLNAANSVLKGVFLSIIAGKNELLTTVESITYEDLMGVCAWVDGKRVLIGNRELMINHSIAVPKADYEFKYQAEGNEVVFLSSEGELCAAFVVEFKVDKGAQNIVSLLRKNDIVGIIKTVDSCVTVELLERLFGIGESMFKILPSRLHLGFNEEMQPLEKADAMLGNNGSLFGSVVSIVACKKLSYCIKIGGFMYLASGIAGVLLLTILTLIRSVSLASCMPMFLFMAVFALVFWIYEKNLKL